LPLLDLECAESTNFDVSPTTECVLHRVDQLIDDVCGVLLRESRRIRNFFDDIGLRHSSLRPKGRYAREFQESMPIPKIMQRTMDRRQNIVVRWSKSQYPLPLQEVQNKGVAG